MYRLMIIEKILFILCCSVYADVYKVQLIISEKLDIYLSTRVMCGWFQLSIECPQILWEALGLLLK